MKFNLLRKPGNKTKNYDVHFTVRVFQIIFHPPHKLIKLKRHSRHLRSLISEAFDRVCEKFVMNAELNKYQRDAILQIL